jgi:hypothetical protein
VKLKELYEYRIAPQQAPLSKDEVLEWLKEAKLTRLHLVIPGEKSVVIFENNFSPVMKAFILVDRKDNTDIVGYMWLKQFDNFWQVNDVHIYKPYQNKGLGLDLYVKLIKNGYKLVNGGSLSIAAEKLWKKLTNFVEMNTYDKKNKKVLDYDNSPAKELQFPDENQQYVWLASSIQLVKEELENFDSLNDKYFIDWLSGKNSVPGTFRTAKYGIDGDL